MSSSAQNGGGPPAAPRARKQLSESEASLLGSVLDGRFRIDKPIGQGAMGTVFAATQLSVGRKVAVKVLREHLSDTATARFMREAKVISQLSHPNVVQLVDFGTRDDGLLYLVMEYVEGERMSRLLKRGRLHPNLAIELVQQLCSALAEAHAHGIIHRDLKPSNMLLVMAADGSVQLKVLDFGVAHTYADADQLTATGVLCGTPAYMAPEQARGGTVNATTDIYAVGINMYEMLCGFRPFRGATPVEVAMKQITAPPPSLRPYVDADIMPLPLVEIVEWMMHKDQAARPESVSLVRQRVLQARADLGWGPVLFPQQAEDLFADWTQPRLANHGGEPADDDLPHGSMAGSWSGSGFGISSTGAGPSQTGAAGYSQHPGAPRPAVFQSGSHPGLASQHQSMPGHPGLASQHQSTSGPHGGAVSGVNPQGQRPGMTSSGLQPGFPAHGDPSVSVDSMPSRHGGGWDAFRDVQSMPGAPGMAADPNLASVAGPAASGQHPHIPGAGDSQAATVISGVHPQPQIYGPAGSGLNPVVNVDQGGAMPQFAGAAPDQSMGTVIEPTSASFEGVWQGNPQQAAQPAAAPAAASQSAPVVAHQPRPGTVYEEPEEKAGFGDVVRFGFIALFAFLLFAGVGFAVFGDKLTKKAPVPQPEPIVAAEPDTGPDAQDEPAKVSPKKNKKPKAKPEPKKPREPIDLFGDQPGGSEEPAKKIIIEEAR